MDEIKLDIEPKELTKIIKLAKTKNIEWLIKNIAYTTTDNPQLKFMKNIICSLIKYLYDSNYSIIKNETLNRLKKIEPIIIGQSDFVDSKNLVYELGIDEKEIIKLFTTGKIPGRKIAGKYITTREQLKKYIEDSEIMEE